jgi:hypothetical protein
MPNVQELQLFHFFQQIDGEAMKLLTTAAAVGSLALTLAACSTPAMTGAMKTPDAPAAVTVPAGHKVAMMATGMGELSYECRARAGAADAWEWVFTGPNAMLYDKERKMVGKYYGGPTWEAADGSKVGGKQLAVAPSPNAGAIPLQLVQAGPAMGNGAMMGVSYIQRLNTMGGIAPMDACGAGSAGMKKKVKYQADYVFYKPA